MTGVDPQKLFAVQVLRNLGHRGGTGRVNDLAHGREARRRVRSALQLAARERLVTSRDGQQYTLTAAAWDAIGKSLELPDQAGAA